MKSVALLGTRDGFEILVDAAARRLKCAHSGDRPLGVFRDELSFHRELKQTSSVKVDGKDGVGKGKNDDRCGQVRVAAEKVMRG